MLILPIALALSFGGQPVQPRTYVSPSGLWSLSVEPSASDGSGITHIVARMNGKVQWSQDGELCLREVVIDDAGHVAAILEGPALEAPCRWLLDGAGKARSSDPLCAPWNSFQRAPELSLLLQAESDRALFRVSDSGQPLGEERWFAYRMSTGEALEDVHPADALEHPADHPRSLDSATIPGTPLVLVQWLLHSTSKEKLTHWGFEYALYDEDWKVVWSQASPRGFDEELRGEEFDYVENGIETACILDARAERRFDVREGEQRVTLEVVRDAAAAKGWRVSEVARAPLVQGTDLWPTRELAKAASIPFTLDPKVEPGPIRDIFAFRFDDDGHIVFVRGEEDEGCTLVRLGDDGKVAREMRVPRIASEPDSFTRWIPASNSDWFFAAEGRRWGSGSTLWRVDGETGAAKFLTELSKHTHDPTIAPLQDGGFVLFIRSTTTPYPHVLEGHGADGSQIWRHEGLAREDDSIIGSMIDVAAAAGRPPLAFYMGMEGLKLLRIDGRGELSLDRELNALMSDRVMFHELLPAPDGSVWMHAYGSSGSWHHVAADGKELRSFTPRTESGSARFADAPCVCDKAGCLWAHDWNQIFQFDEQGIAHPKFGRAPEPKLLTNPISAYFDDNGRIAIEDWETAALHLFDAKGKRTAICVPDPTDFDAGNGVDTVFASSDGGVIAVEHSGGSYITFAPDGKRTGSGSFGGELTAFDRRTRERWSAEVDEHGLLRLKRFDTAGKVALEVERRRPDGAFFVYAIGLDVAPDGAAVVLDCTGSLCFYARDGKPLREIAFGIGEFWNTGRLHVGKRWIATGILGAGALLVSLPDGACSRFVPEGATEEDSLWTYALSPDEKELWAVHMEPKPVLHRFTLPD